MTNLVETPQWEPGIYQLETLDPVQGGPNGIDNLQAKQLGNRTQFLKALIEAAQNSLAGHESAADPHSQYLTTAEGNSMIASAVSALVNSSPATLDTLNELATALGNDPNFATSMATALGLKAPLNSPAFSGNPSAPTPSALDNDLSIATTEFVKRSGLTFASAAYITSLPSTLTASHAGHFVNVSVGATGQLFLPLASSVQNGAAITVFNASSYSIQITRFSNPDIIVTGNGSSATTYDMEAGTFAVFTCDNGGWVMGARTSQLGKTAIFGSSLSGNGYQKLPSGLIIQWGNSSSIGTGSPNCSVTFPVAFPNACFTTYATLSGTTQGGYVNSNPGATKTTGIFTLFNAGGSITSAWGFQWIAIGY